MRYFRCAFLSGVLPLFGCPLVDLHRDGFDHRGRRHFLGRLEQGRPRQMFDPPHRPARSKTCGSGHSAAGAAVHMAATALALNCLGVVLGNVGPGEAGHEVIQRRALRSARAKQDRATFGV